MTDRDRGGGRAGRRGFLATVAAGCCGAVARGGDAIREARNEALQALLRQADVGPLWTTATGHYVVGSDEPIAARLAVAARLEGFLGETWGMLRSIRPGMQAPAKKLRVLFLGDPRKYERMARAKGIDPEIKGWYAADVAAILMTHEARTGDADRDRDQSTWTLRHEGTHQITYECGWLNPSGDHPPCIVEGLAVVGEPGPIGPAARTPPVHPRYLDWLSQSPDRDRVSLDALIRDDGWPRRFADPEARSGGYARSWLLMHLLMSDPKLRPRLDAYLAAIFRRIDPSRRLEDVEAHLGKLDDLEARMGRHLRDLASRPSSRFRSPRRASRA